MVGFRDDIYWPKEDNIKMDLQEVGRAGVMNCIDKAQVGGSCEYD
jgi:hypothetical protein